MTSSCPIITEKEATEGLSSYERYLQAIDSGMCIVHDDRIKLHCFKKHNKTGKKFPLKAFWYRSKILYSEIDYYRDDETKELKSRIIHYFNKQEIQGTVFEGCYLKIVSNNIILELHNILNRYPNKSRLSILVMVLRGLHEEGILNPGSLSSFYRVAHMFSVSEYELRYDFKGLVDLEAIEKLGNRYEHTLYFTDKKARTKMKLYQRKDFYRFEMTFTRQDLSLKGTPQKIVQQIHIGNILSRKKELRDLLKPILDNQVYLEDLQLDGENLFRMSEYMFYLYRPNRPKQGL